MFVGCKESVLFLHTKNECLSSKSLKYLYNKYVGEMQEQLEARRHMYHAHTLKICPPTVCTQNANPLTHSSKSYNIYGIQLAIFIQPVAGMAVCCL